MRQIQTGREKGLSRETIKYIAMAAMLLNHIANVFLTPGTVLCEVFLDIGYFTAVTMCCFLAEGYRYTSSPGRYALRLFLFAAVSQLPYNLALTENGVLSFTGLNMMFTLFVCFLIILANDKVQNRFLKAAAILALTLLTVISDWPVLAPIFTLLFIRADGDRTRIKNAFALIFPIFALFDFIGRTGLVPLWQNVFMSLCAASGIALSGVCIVYAYNGRRGRHTGAFSKWFFFFFYPAHLLALGLIRLAVSG